MKGSHLTLRLTATLARALSRWAAARGVPKSQVARDAVAQYLAPKSEGMRGAPSFTALDLVQEWAALPRLESDEAESFARDIASARATLPGVPPSWE